MDISAVEAAIVARLDAQISGAKVRPYPDVNFDAGHQFKADELLVRYLGSEFPTPEPNRTGEVEQRRQVLFEVTELHSNLRVKDEAHRGAYTLIESVRTALSGYTIPSLPDASRMYPVRDSFVEKMEGLWAYASVFGFTVPEVAV